MITHEAVCSDCGGTHTYYGYNHADISEHMLVAGWARTESGMVCHSCWMNHVSRKAAKHRAAAALGEAA